MGKGKKITKLLKNIRETRQGLIAAVEDENYEVAAILRDKLNLLQYKLVKRSLGKQHMTPDYDREVRQKLDITPGA